jgi:hypothetical protein
MSDEQFAAATEATRQRLLEQADDQRLELAVAAYEAHDEMVGPGGVFANLSRSEKLRLETAVYRDHGPRVEYKTPAEILEDERIDVEAETAAMAKELADWNTQMLLDMGYASMEDMRAGNKAPVPSLIETADGVPAYLLPGGEIVEQYAVAFGRTAKNPRFDAIDQQVKRIQQSRR